MQKYVITVWNVACIMCNNQYIIIPVLLYDIKITFKNAKVCRSGYV